MVHIHIIANGVFVAEDVRKDAGESAYVPPDIAVAIVKNGHAKHG